MTLFKLMYKDNEQLHPILCDGLHTITTKDGMMMTATQQWREQLSAHLGKSLTWEEII